MSIRSLAVMGALLRLRHNTQQLGIRLVLDGVFNHSGDSHAWFDRHNRGTGGACHNPESPWRDWYSFSDDGTALDWLGYASLPKLDYQSESLVNEIYRGEDSIVRPLAESAVEYGWLAAGCGAYAGGSGWGAQ